MKTTVVFCLTLACLHEFLLIFGEGGTGVERKILGGWHEMDNMDYTNLSFKSFGKTSLPDNSLIHKWKNFINGIGYTLFIRSNISFIF